MADDHGALLLYLIRDIREEMEKETNHAVR